jgi:hypothetical protein
VIDRTRIDPWEWTLFSSLPTRWNLSLLVEPRVPRLAKDGGRAASPCGQSPSILSKVVVELRREIVEGKGGKEGEGGRSATNL